MEPITWSVIAGLIVQYGLPLAEKIWQRAASGAVPTQADFDELKAMGQETPEDLLKQVVEGAGLDAKDPRVLELAKLIAAKT